MEVWVPQVLDALLKQSVLDEEQEPTRSVSTELQRAF